MSAELDSGDGQMERGSIPLDIDNVHMLLQVEQEQIQKRTFTNWVNAQLAKRRPPCRVLDLFNDFRDGSKLLDLLEAMSGQHFSRERGRGMFQHRSNIEKALSFLQKKSIKLVNINIPDIIDGKPSIILGLIWTIILQYHIEELASCLSFDSRQSSMESLASLDTRSTLSSRSASSSPVPPKGSALHNRFRVSAKKALLLWVREQCHKAGCTINVKDFKASWRSGVVFLAILHALRPDVVDLSKAKTRSNKQNLKEAFLIAEKELRIPRLLEPDDVDVRDPDEKSIMTYVAQFLQYSRDMPVAEEEMQTHYLTPPKSSSPINLPLHYTPAISASPLRQATADQKAKEVTHWLVQAYEELLEGWDSTEGESYSERYHVFQTFLVSFNEQRRPIMPLLTAMRRTSKLSEEQRALREAWDSLSEKLREYKTELDMSLPPLLDTVARWLLKTEGVLAEEQGDPQDHGCAADEAREKQELLKVCLEEMPQQMRTFQSFQNMDEYGNLMVPTDKMDELKRRFTSVRVTAKYHGIKLEYWEHRHTVLDLLGQIRSKLHMWKRPYISPEAVRLLLQEWHDLVNTQGLPSLLEAALRKLKQISEKYSSKSALAADYHQVSKQVKQLEEETARALEELTRAKGIMGHVMSAWETYRDCLSSLQAWLEQGSVTHSHGVRPLVPSESMAEWGTRHAQLNEVGHLLIESTDPATSRSVTEELRKLNMHWAEFVKKNISESQELSADIQANAQDLQALIREATLILKEPLETMAGPLRTYRKRLQFIIGKIKQVDIDALVPSPDCSSDQLRKLRLATPEVMQTLFEAEQVCAELQHSVSGLDSRLAELLHWEMEARELYQQLRSTDRKQKQSSQDPRARVIISRGLQLEGQVVTEEQDLQVIVMTKQKSSPLQYLLASTMQERIQAAVAQSQEAIGMLSSLGSRRDKNRSPTEAGPPSKVLRESNTEQPSQRPVTHHRDDFSVPEIVVHEYKEEKMMSHPMSYVYAQPVEQTMAKSPPNDQTQVCTKGTEERQQEIQEQVLKTNQQLDQEELHKHTTHMKNEVEKQKRQSQKHGLPLTEVDEQGLTPTQPRLHQLKQEQQREPYDFCQHQDQQHRVTTVQVETEDNKTAKLHEQTLHQQTASKKKSLSSKELQNRKIQAMKNRPWLQRKASGEQKTPNTVQDSGQIPVQTAQITSQSKTETADLSQDVSQRTSNVGAQTKAKAKLTKQTYKQQQGQKNEKPHSQSKEQPQILGMQQEEMHAVVRQAQLDSATKNKTQTITETQHSTQTKVKKQAQLHSMSKPQLEGEQVQPTTVLQIESSEDQSHMFNYPQPHAPVKTQPLTQTQSHLHPQTYAPGLPQQSLQPQNLPHSPAVAQSQTWAPIRPSSPMQASLPGHFQQPVPSHIQLRSHPQSWAPVRPPSPKPPTNVQPEDHGQLVNVTQIHAQQMAQSQSHPQTRIQHQPQPQQKASPQTHANSPLVHTQTNVQRMENLSQAQPPNQHQAHVKPAVHLQGHSMTDPVAQFSTHPQALVPQLGLSSPGQLQAWTQLRASSPMSVQHLQGTVQPQLYPQGFSQSQISVHQWTDKKTPPNQAIALQEHHIPQQYPKQIAQLPHPQTYATAHTLPQWAQQGHQTSPQGHPHIGQSYPQSQIVQTPTQPWLQTQPQIHPQTPIPQKPQMTTYSSIQAEQGLLQQQTWIQTSPQQQSQPYHQRYLPVQHPDQPMNYHQSHIETKTHTQSQPLHQVYPSQIHLQTLPSPSNTHTQTQPVLQTKPNAKTHRSQPSFPEPKQSQLQQGESFTQSKPQIPFTTQEEFELPAQGNVHPKIPSKSESVPQHKPHVQIPGQLMASSTSKANVEFQSQVKVQTQVVSQPAIQSQTQPKDESHVRLKADSILQSAPELLVPKVTMVASSTKSEGEPMQQSRMQFKSQQPQNTVPSQVTVLPETQLETSDIRIKPPALAQAPVQAYTEAYYKAQALARNGFEEAKHCLQAHIMEAITVFKDKRFSAEQASVKEDTLRALDPELLDEFLRAAKGMEAFCTPAQLGDMEFFTQSVRTQWEAVRAEISGFLQQLRFEVRRRDFNKAALQCERSFSSCLENMQACFSRDFSEAGQHLEALKELCDTLSPEDAHRLAQTQLMECEKRLAAIQRQFSGDKDTSHSDSRIQLAFSEDPTTQKEPKKANDKPQPIAEVSQVTTTAEERREVEKQTSVEEVSKKDIFERYENCKRTLQTQMAKNEHSFKDVPSDSVSLKGLHTRLQEIQFLRQETESLWSEYTNQCSQCTQMSGDISVEQEKIELQEQWRSQQANLQRRGSSLSAALRQIDSTENHMVDFVDRLDRYLRQPKDITGFTLANTNILKDIKELDDNIQNELDQLFRLNPESSDLDPRECFPLTREVETHKASLDQLRQQVRKSEAAARALDRFLMSLRTVDEDISGVQGAPCSDSVVLQDCRSKLALIRQSIDSLKEKAPQLDLLLQGARLTVTRDGVPASCLDMVNALLRRLEEADTGLASQQRGLQKETQSKSLGLRKRALLGELKRLLETIEKQGLKESTMPAVQHKLRALSDLEGQLQAQHSELHSLRELQEKEGGGEDLLQELEAQWNETQTSFFERKKQCNVLLELLKKYQTCRSHLSNTIQKAEQTITDQASYMGKDNLQRSMTKVSDIKEELGCLGEQMEEMRGVCKQLQSELKKFPECSETLFEAEAHILMDNWLDVTEKTDAFMDNLRVGLELWEKQLMLGGEVDSWAGAKLSLFAESHPFHNEKQVLAMRDEIHANEENITHFHKKSVEIQEMLQSQEAPLELQVMETNLRKRMEQVKELFTDCTDVFEELIAVRKHLSEKIEECQTAVEHIQSCLSKLNASDTKVEAQIQDLCEDLESQEKQAEAVLKEVGLVSSVASPRVLEELSVDCTKLKEAISRTKDMIHLKREEGEKGLLKVINDETQSFEEWFQDLQLSVNECFENPESRTDVEISVQRLHGFLKSHDTKRRLDQLKDQIDRGSKQFPPQQLSELNNWLKEQKEEVDTFKTHCHNRQKQMDSLLDDLNCLQKQHDSFREWLQSKEKQSLVPENVKFLLQDLHHESDRAETVSELLASIRRQGVRADNLLKDGDNLIQRYRNLEARLQKQADAQKAIQEEYQKLKTKAESTVAWMSDLLQPITFPGRKTEMEIKSTALAVLNSKSKGESEIHYLRRQLETLCEQGCLEESKKQEAQLFVRDAEEQWRSALQAAEEAVHKAETQIVLNKANDAFQTQNESFQSWIKDQNDSLNSLGANMQTEEKKRILQTILSSRPDGESKLQDLKQKFQILCNSEGLKDNRRQEIRDAVKHAEEQWSKVLHSAEEGLIYVEKEAASERDFVAFKNQNETIRSWIRQQRQRVLDLSSLMQFEERLQIAQAVMASESERESKLLDLNRQSESLCEHIEESRKLEIEQLLNNTEQQWRTVLQSARQAELRCLSDDFESQSKHTESWIRDKQQKLNSAGSHKTPEERCQTAQTLLTSRPEGDYKVNNLRRRGQSLCDHQDADEGRNAQVQQAVKDIEEQWRAVLQAAKEVEAAAEAEISQESERKILELREFNTHQQGVTRWLEVIQQQLESLSSLTNAEDRLRAAEAVMSLKPEGDLKLQELRRQAQSLCDRDLEKRKKQEVQQHTQDTEERWLRILQAARQAVSQSERQCALDGQVKDFQVLRGIIWAWLEEKKQNLISLDNQTNQEKAINTAQKILSSKPEGDSKLTELRRQSQSLADQEDLEERTKREAQQAVQDSEEEWKIILQTAENNLKKAEIQYFLSKELESFWTHENSTKTLVEDMQTKADSMGEGTRGTTAQIEERLNTARVILSSKSNVATQVTELKRRAQSICDHRDLDKNKRDELQQIVRNTEAKWTRIVHIAEERLRELQGVVERLVSSQYKRDQAGACLAELQKQTDNLPCVFPWPGLGERRQAVEQARILLDKSVALAPVLLDVRAQATELFEITQDQSWQVPAWAAEEAIPALLKKLTDAVENLEQGILTERHCTLLIEQHQAAQDWLKEQVKGLGPPPVDKHGLHSAANNLKALLQTVDREQREMKELDASKESLLRLCTPGGQDALNLEVSHLHNLCVNSEREVKEHLSTCERRLEEMDCELAKMAQELKDRAAALQWELRSLDQALSYSEPQDNIDQLKQHWHSLQNCEMSLQYLGVKVHDLYQEIMLLSSTNELPPETIRVVESLCQQHASLKSRLGEHQSSCSSNTASCLQDCLDALGKWNNSTPSDSISSVQGTLEEGEKLMNTLQEVLSHQKFLTACLEPECFERLQKEKSEILRELDLHKANLRQHLKELEQRSKEPVIQTPDVLHYPQERKDSVVAPPRKNKHLTEQYQDKQPETMSLTDKYTTTGEQLPFYPEEMHLEGTSQFGREVIEITCTTVEGISIEPSERIHEETKSKKVQRDVPISVEQMRHTVEDHIVIQQETDLSVLPVSEDTLPLPSRRKSKSKPTETGSSTSLFTAEDVVNEPEFVLGQSETADFDQSKVLPPRRKSRSPNLTPKYTKTPAPQMKEEPESQKCAPDMMEQAETTLTEQPKLIPVRRKSKTAESPTGTKPTAPHSPEVEPEDANKTSSPQVEIEPTTAPAVQENKPSPTKRRSKGQKLHQEDPAGEVRENKQGPGSEKPLTSSGVQNKLLAEETKIIPTRRKSKSLDVSTALDTRRMPIVDRTEQKQEPEKSSASPVIISGTTETMLLPPKRKSKSNEFYKSLPDVAQMSGEPEVEETNILPTRRKSKTGDLSKTSETSVGSSSSDVITGASETTKKDKGKLSPTKRKSKSLRTTQADSSNTVKDKTKETDEQRSAEEAEKVVLKETIVIPAKRKSKSSDVFTAFKSSESTDSDSKEAREKIESESVSAAQQSITVTTEEVEKNKDWQDIMSCPVASPELPFKEETPANLMLENRETEVSATDSKIAINTVESVCLEGEPDAMEVVRTSEVVMDQTENVASVSKTAVDNIIPVNDKTDIPYSGTDSTKDLQEMRVTTVILDTSDTHPFQTDICTSVIAEPLKSDIMPSSLITFQTICESTERGQGSIPQIQPSISSDATDTPNIVDYINHLWENTTEIKKRYLVLDLPDIGVTKTSEIMQDQPGKAIVAENSSTSTSVASGITQPHREVTEISPTGGERMKTSESLDEVNLSKQEIPQEKLEVKDYDDQAKEIRNSAHGLLDSYGSQEEISNQKWTEVRILQLDIPSGQADIEHKFVTIDKEPGEDITETITHSQSVLESDVQLENNMGQRDSAQPSIPELTALTKHRAELIEISIYEKDTVKPEQTGLLEDAEPATLQTYDIGIASKSFDDESVTEKMYMGHEVRILQLDIQSSDKNLITIEEEPTTELIQTNNQREEKITADDIPRNTATEITKLTVQTDSADYKDNVAQGDLNQLTTLAFQSIEPHETRYIEIDIDEKDIVIPSHTETETELLNSKQQPEKDPGTQESHFEVLVNVVDGDFRIPDESSVEEDKKCHDVHVIQLNIPGSLKEGPASGSERQEDVAQSEYTQNISVLVETTFEEISLSEQDTENTIQKGNQVEILQPDTPEQQITSVEIKEVPQAEGVQTTIQCENVTEIESFSSADILSAGAEMSMTIVQIEKQGQQEPINNEPNENGSQLKSNKAPSERLEVEKEADVPEKRAAPLTHDMQDPPQTSDEMSVEITVLESKTVIMEKDTEAESCISILSVKESKDGLAGVAQYDGSASEMAKVSEQRRITDSLHKPCDVQETEIEEISSDKTNINAGPQPKMKTERDGEEKETTVIVELSLQKEQEKVLGDKISTESLQTIEKLSTDSVLVEETQLERPTSTESKATASVLMMENVVVEPLQKSAMNNIFSEIQKLAETGTISQLIEGKPLEDGPQTLITSTTDLDMRLSRLVSKVLSLKNCPAELSLTSMARQLEEAQECRLLAQLQVSLFSELKEADTINRETLENMEDQWNTAAQDGAAVIQSKEAQLDLVTDYWTQTQTVNATVDKLSAELDAVQRSPQENSQQEVEQLCYLQRSMEENRTVLGELLVTHTKLYLHLSQSDREAAQMGLKNLQERWGALERRIESNLHHTKVHSEHSNSLLSELSSLQECIEKIQKDLETMSPSVGQWNCKDAQQLMQSNAEIKAAHQQCQHLQKLSEEFLLNLRWEIESKEIDHRLQDIKDKLSHSEELMSSKSKNSSNPIMEKIIIVMRDGLAWARETESDIEGRRKRVPLLPEEVHRQLRGLKKLQADVMAKQGQLESLVEEVTELFPQMDQVEEVPIVHSSLECLEELSKSTTEKLSKAMKEVETGLQTREKLFEQIADLDSWILAHLQSMAAGSSDSEPLSQVELGSKVHRIQQTQAEAERQAAICEAIYMNSKDIASELSVTETCLHFDKIRNLQEDIRTINRKEKANKEELEELIKTIDSRKKNAVTVENSLRLILADLSKHRYPITRESLQTLEPFKLLILEHKSQIDLLVPWIPREKSNELNSVISELQNKIISLEIKSKDHERYLNMRQCVEDLKEHIQEQVHQTKEESRDHKERYRLCHTLLNQFPLMRELCKEARSMLQMISSDLYPSQLTVEQQRLKQNEESLETWEMAVCNNLRLVEWDVLKELDIESEKKAIEFFLLKTQKELRRPSLLEPDLTLIDKEYQGVLSLKKTVESRTKVLEVLEQKKGNKDNQGSQDLMTLKNAVLSQCDSQMENICHARGCLRGYTYAVNEALRFLRDIEACILPPQGSAGPCCESLKETQQTLLTLEDLFQTHVEQLQNHFAQQTCLSPQKLEHLQQNILSQLLVKKSTLQAKCHVRHECLNRCAEQHSIFSKSYDEIIQRLTNVEIRLLEVISQQVSCLAECTVQKEKFTMLSGEMESLLKNLEGLKEWCPEQSCRGGREVTVTTLWRRVSRLHHCTQELVARSKQKVTEWLDITNSVEKASMELEQVEAELPDDSSLKASTEELQDLLHSWEQYQDTLDCDNRALCALELRTANRLAVPVPVEQAHPTILCQQLQEMQGRYDSLRQRSAEGVLAVKLELEERDKLREELQVVRVWVEAADSLLSDMEQCSSTEELQDIYSQLFVQKALLQQIMESIKMKYSDMSSLAPVEIQSQLEEVSKSMEHVEAKVGEAMEKSGPVHQLGAKLSEIQAGLRSVQKRLEERSPTVIEAKFTQKRAWDELDMWHSRLASLEVDMQDLEKPEEALGLTERLVEVQELHSLLAKQAEQRTTLLSKIHTWLQEHKEMINSSKSWMAEAESWLSAPCTYTTAKCLSSHVNALQLVLDDAAQIRATLQGFSSVLKEMSQVCDITNLQEQLNEADRQVADVQDSFSAPLSQLEHAAAEVEAIESEVKRMENDVAEIKALLSSPETFPKPKEDSLQEIELRIQSMSTTIAEIQKCKPGLCLPEKAEETLTVFNVVGQLQTLLLELEKKVPALFIQQPPTPDPTKMSAKLQNPISEEAEEEQGQIRVVHLEEDVLKRSGGTLQTVEQSSPEQIQSRTLNHSQQQHQGVLQAGETPETRTNERPKVEDFGGSVMWWLWDAFLGASPEVPAIVVSDNDDTASGQSTEQTEEDKKGVLQDVEGAEASSSEVLSKPVGTVRTQSLPESMVNTASTVNPAKPDSKPQQRCVVS